MAEQLSEHMQRRIDALVRETFGAKDADDPVALELRGHIEDKILAYLNGDEALSEDDAFVLAREHLGDPENLRGLLATTPQVLPTPGIARKVMQFSVVFFAFTAVNAVVNPLLWAVSPLLGFTLGHGMSYVFLLVVWGVLRRAKQRQDERPWFSGWHAGHFALAFLAVASVRALAGRVSAPLYASRAWEQGVIDFLWWYQPVMRYLLLPVYMIMVGWLCLWWCDAKQGRAILQSLATFSAVWLSIQVIHLVVLLSGRQALDFHSLSQSGLMLLSLMAGQFLVIALPLLLGGSVYWWMQRRRGRNFPELAGQ